jgi:hypothetical protein
MPGLCRILAIGRQFKNQAGLRSVCISPSYDIFQATLLDRQGDPSGKDCSKCVPFWLQQQLCFAWLHQALKLVIIAIATTITVITIITASANTLTLRGVLARGAVGT